jgi:hypothetical protein
MDKGRSSLARVLGREADSVLKIVEKPNTSYSQLIIENAGDYFARNNARRIALSLLSEKGSEQ